jgi:hypothetical protein
MSRRPRDRHVDERAQERLTVLGRASLEAAGFGDGTIRKAYRALDEALDATRTKDFQFHGDVISGPDRADHEVRVRAAELVTKIADHHVAKIGIEFDGNVRMTSDEELLSILESLGVDPRLALGAATASAELSTGEPGTQDHAFPVPALDRSRRPAKQ